MLTWTVTEVISLHEQSCSLAVFQCLRQGGHCVEFVLSLASFGYLSLRFTAPLHAIGWRLML